MVAQFVAGWRKTGTPASRKSPRRIAPKHAAILVTRPADKMTDEQQQLLDFIEERCPEVVDLRRIALSFPDASMADESTELRQWIARTQRCEFGPGRSFRLWLGKRHLRRFRRRRPRMEHGPGKGANQPSDDDQAPDVWTLRSITPGSCRMLLQPALRR